MSVRAGERKPELLLGGPGFWMHSPSPVSDSCSDGPLLSSFGFWGDIIDLKGLLRGIWMDFCRTLPVLLNFCVFSLVQISQTKVVYGCVQES